MILRSVTKRRFLASGAGVGLGLGLGAKEVFGQGLQPQTPTYMRGPQQSPNIPHRMAKTTPLFKSPRGFPNALAVMTDAPGGLWIGEQKLSGSQAIDFGVPEPKDLHEAAWLVDWSGKLLKTVMTPSRNTSGIAYGNGCVWMGANELPEGIFQVDMNGTLVNHHQIPLGPAHNGGGCYGLMYQDGKLWISAHRLRGVLRVDAKTWEPELLIPFDLPKTPRLHAAAWDNGTIWLVAGTDSQSWADSQPGLARFDAESGELLETVSFLPRSADPHGLIMYQGSLYSCDAGIHPGWVTYDSPMAGYIFRIDFV